MEYALTVFKVNADIVLFIRPAQTNMNSQTANAALKRIGYGGKLVAHGLRIVASTALNEAEFNSDAIEVSLAHADKNEVRRAYNRSIYPDIRTVMMDWWGNFVTKNSI
ncbi:prophage integrase [Pectobacterium atrosepticum ICMP 1526]|nr:prophage integrase [Pectobacterium atrosepticum ICMP 1526]